MERSGLNMELEDSIDRSAEGRQAFRAQGVSGIKRIPYRDKTFARDSFRRGFDEARDAEAKRSLKEARSYHALSLRDNVIDRKWANKLAALS